MKKRVLPLVLVFLILLVSCSKPGESAEEMTPTLPAATAENTPAAESDQNSSTGTYTDADNPCRVYNDLDELLPPDPAFPEVTADDWVSDPVDAPITLTVYDQFDCPGCKYFETQLPLLKEAFPNEFRLVFRHFFFHDNADLPARAAEAAGRQGKFFEVKSFIFEDVENWYGKTGTDFETWIRSTAEKFDLDADQMVADFNDQEVIDKVAAENQKSQELGLSATPSIFINNWRYTSSDNQVPGFEVLSALFDAILQMQEVEASQYDSCPPMTVDQKLDYQMTISTDKGDIVIDLNDDEAPYAVNAIMFLADEGWYDDLSFYAVEENFVLTGDPSNTSYGSPGFVFLDEISTSRTFNEEGVVGMYHPAPGRNSSQIFITKKPMADIDSVFTVLGKVTEGLDILNQLAKDDNIISVVVSEK
jgi:cyclophilin family peptidyl-prolyl cis-trans isomerase/protein-disulfide isomerase